MTWVWSLQVHPFACVGVAVGGFVFVRVRVVGEDIVRAVFFCVGFCFCASGGVMLLLVQADLCGGCYVSGLCYVAVCFSVFVFGGRCSILCSCLYISVHGPVTRIVRSSVPSSVRSSVRLRA